MTNKERVYDYLHKLYGRPVDELLDKSSMPVIDEVFESWVQRVIGSPDYKYSIFQNRKLDILADYNQHTYESVNAYAYYWMDSIYLPKFTLYKSDIRHDGAGRNSAWENVFDARYNFTNDANAFGFYFRKGNKTKLVTNGYRGYYILSNVIKSNVTTITIGDNDTYEDVKKQFEMPIDLITNKMKRKFDIIAEAKGTKNTTKTFENRPLMIERTNSFNHRETSFTQRKNYIDIDLGEINNRLFYKRIDQNLVGTSKEMLYINGLAPVKMNTPSKMTETQRADLVNTITNIGPELDYPYDAAHYIPVSVYNELEEFINETWHIEDEPYDLAKLLAGEVDKLIKDGLNDDGYKEGDE